MVLIPPCGVLDVYGYLVADRDRSIMNILGGPFGQENKKSAVTS